MAFGICSKEVIKNNDFEFFYKKLNHGCYLISNNKYAWSSHQSNVNFKYITELSFNQGDVVNCHYFPLTGKIKFEVKGISKEFFMDVFDSKTKEYFGCVYLCNPQDKVEILGRD